MSITGYKRLAFALALISISLLLALAYGFQEYSYVAVRLARSTADYRQAHDIVCIYEADRDLALKQDVTNAVERLYKLQGPQLPFEKDNPAAMFVERERRRAVSDVIAYLRLKTGKNLGDEPAPWILAYGDDNLKMNQEALPEMLEMVKQVKMGNYSNLLEGLRTNR